MFKLSQKLRDKVTGFEGIAISRCEFLNGNILYGIKPYVGNAGKMPEVEYIDEGQLEYVSSELISSRSASHEVQCQNQPTRS